MRYCFSVCVSIGTFAFSKRINSTSLAAQIPAELFDRLDRYLKERSIKKKDFLVDIIARALEAAEAVETVDPTESVTETPLGEAEETSPHDALEEQPEADEF